jgi:hypothetical protein
VCIYTATRESKEKKMKCIELALFISTPYKNCIGISFSRLDSVMKKIGRLRKRTE